MKQHVVNLDLTGDKNKEITKDALLWLLTYGHMEVYTKEHFGRDGISSNMPLVFNVKMELAEVIFVGMAEMKPHEYMEAAEMAEKFGLMGFVAWLAFKNGENDVIQECYKTEEYNNARKYLGLGKETQMPNDYELMEDEDLEVIILAYCDCMVDLTQYEMEGGYQGWINISPESLDEDEVDN